MVGRRCRRDGVGMRVGMRVGMGLGLAVGMGMGMDMALAVEGWHGHGHWQGHSIECRCKNGYVGRQIIE